MPPPLFKPLSSHSEHCCVWVLDWPSVFHRALYGLLLLRILESHSHFINSKMKVLPMNCMFWLFSASLALGPLAYSVLSHWLLYCFLSVSISNSCRTFAFIFSGNTPHRDVSIFRSLIPSDLWSNSTLRERHL